VSRAMRRAVPLYAVAILCGCTKEARELGPATPQTPPIGNEDPRIPTYQDNFYQVSQGGRYFAWYGCSGCHAEGKDAVLNLADSEWRHGFGFANVYGAIAARHGRLAYGKRIPVEQMWQITAYARDLSSHYPEKRRRVALDQQAEPVGGTWHGPQ